MSQGTQQDVLVERHGAVAVLTMNQAAKRNSMGPALCAALVIELESLQADRSCRAVVLSGGAHFCAGGSLDGLDTRVQVARQDMRDGHRLIRSIAAGRLPVIAAVEGAAFGAGLALASACDFVAADAQAKLGAVFGLVGLMPDWGSMWTLPQRIGAQRTRELAMFQQVLGAEEAKAIGLVDWLAEPGAVLPFALKKAQHLAAAAPGPITATKTLLARPPGSLDPLLDWEADTQAILLSSEDFAEGRDAFFAKRAPVFKGL